MSTPLSAIDTVTDDERVGYGEADKVGGYVHHPAARRVDKHTKGD